MACPTGWLGHTVLDNYLCGRGGEGLKLSDDRDYGVIHAGHAHMCIYIHVRRKQLL